jgi:hypothetical protein
MRPFSALFDLAVLPLDLTKDAIDLLAFQDNDKSRVRQRVERIAEDLGLE